MSQLKREELRDNTDSALWDNRQHDRGSAAAKTRTDNTDSALWDIRQHDGVSAAAKTRTDNLIVSPHRQW